jgi:hypothetical protein
VIPPTDPLADPPPADLTAADRARLSHVRARASWYVAAHPAATGVRDATADVRFLLDLVDRLTGADEDRAAELPPDPPDARPRPPTPGAAPSLAHRLGELDGLRAQLGVLTDDVGYLTAGTSLGSDVTSALRGAAALLDRATDRLTEAAADEDGP